MKVKRKVIVYVDGFNVYYGMKEAFRRRYRWLDYQQLAEGLLKEGMELVRVVYFTANIKGNGDGVGRQKIYLKALEAHCDKLTIIKGKFLLKDVWCPKCKQFHQKPEEKQTDVNIACEMLQDAHRGAFDVCYLLSGDSDLVPPLKILAEDYPDRPCIVAFPPNRKSDCLSKNARSSFMLNEKRFKRNQLPDEILLPSKTVVHCPKPWRFCQGGSAS